MIKLLKIAVLLLLVLAVGFGIFWYFNLGMPLPKQSFKLSIPGTEFPVDYAKYGKFHKPGTARYRYLTKDPKGLVKASGEGVYPDTTSILKDPLYKRYIREGKLKGNRWEFINSGNYAADFFKWATAREDYGVKQFYIAMNLENAGHIKQAIKAYYAVLVYFPKSVGWTYWHTPWYVARGALDSVLYLTQRYPRLGLKLEGADVFCENGFNDNIRDDQIFINPGKFKKVFPWQVKSHEVDLKRLKKIKTTGGKNSELIEYDGGRWQLMVKGKPFIVKAVTYTPTTIGQSPDEGTLKNWMIEDTNNNGLIDAPYEAWVDTNRNGIQDTDEKSVGDFKLMADMGVNAIRLYHHPFKLNKKLLRDLYKKHGIGVILGDFLGMYAIGSGASWYRGTDYSNPEHRANMLLSVRKMVEEYKDEPYILMWLLGNENNYGVANNAKKNPEAYYEFVDEAAKLIKSLDPTRVVIIGNGDLLFLDIFAKHCKNIDIFGTNVYCSSHGMGYTFWKSVQRVADKPVLITESGCPAYAKNESSRVAEDKQAHWLEGIWSDIYSNNAGRGVGNAIGFVLFEWIDEWWKAYKPFEHDTKRNWAGPFPDNWMYEEWLGLCSHGTGKNSPFERVLRKGYYKMCDLWKK